MTIMNNYRILLSLVLFWVLILASNIFAEKKAIYIKPFGLVQGLPANDPAGNHIKDYISEKIIEQGTFFITSDDEVRQVIAQEELRMSLDGCYDDACIKKLMENIKTDYIVYGTVSIVDGLFYVTAKILDRSSGRIELSRVKTLKFRNRDHLEDVSKIIGIYLITDDNSAIQKFEAEEKEREYAWKENEGRGDTVVGRRKNIETRSSLFRIGYGRPSMDSSTIKNGMTIESAPSEKPFEVMLDWFPLTFRSSRGNGFDIMIRGSIRDFGAGAQKNLVNKKLVLKDQTVPVIAEYDLEAIGGFLGGRYITGFYNLGILWQMYAGGAYQYLQIKEDASPPQGGAVMPYELEANTYGMVGFLGVEIGLSPNFAVFLECSYGRHPVGYAKVNMEGFSYQGGIALRTSFL
jgi:hypothetical protein